MTPEIRSEATLPLERSRIADYITLTKPELTFLSVLTALGGLFLASGGAMAMHALVHTLLGTALVGGGAGALNQYIERHYDSLMRRTSNRPLPSGRLTPLQVLFFGWLLAIAGIVEIAIFLNLLTAFLAFLTLVTYLFLYTPLKRITWVSTIIGGIPGALPPVMGWTAAQNEISLPALALFGILFCWQMPHFFSLAWMYRKDYERAGFPMLPVLDQEGRKTGNQVVLYTLGLIPVSIGLSLVGPLGVVYAVGAAVLGILFLLMALDLARTRSSNSARRLFFGSLAYLPALLAVMVLDLM